MMNIKNESPRYNTSLGQRYIYLKNSFQLITLKPFWGFGVNQFEKTYQNYFHYKETKHPHNNFIFILLELGICGILLLFSIFYFQVIAYFNSNRKNVLKFIFPVFFLFIMLFDNYFVNHNTLAFFCLFSFIIYHSASKSFINHKLS